MAVGADTIAAIATPPGQGGLGVIRVSGPESGRICRALTGALPEPRIARYAALKTKTGELIDRGIVIYFKAPASYTGEDLLECQVHGSRMLLALLLDEIVSLGARLAGPGEFTERAFLNGKLDLIQAEAVADLIASQSKKAALAAARSLEGVFSREVGALKDRILRALATVEAALDFPDEEDVSPDLSPLESTISGCRAALADLLTRARAGHRLRQTPAVVIAGPPNAGKSCIMNALSGHDAAIVSDTPGTTRDTVREELMLGQQVFTLIDTAGQREAADGLEQEGINRANKAIREADLTLLVFAVNEPVPALLEALRGRIPPARRLLVWNKIDLQARDPVADPGAEDAVYLSARSGAGMDTLRACLARRLAGGQNIEHPLLARERHIQALNEIHALLGETSAGLAAGEGLEIVAERLRQLLRGFDGILGRATPDAVLGEIFSRFCIGK